MLCADSCFSETLRGGSGYQVASDQKPHDRRKKKKKRKRLYPGVMSLHTHTHTDIKHSYTTRITHREERVACHRLAANGIGRPVEGTVIKPTQWPIAKTGHGTKVAMKGGETDPAITHCSHTAGLCGGVDLAPSACFLQFSAHVAPPVRPSTVRRPNRFSHAHAAVRTRKCSHFLFIYARVAWR